MIHAVDWFPTLLTLAGGTPDVDMDGRNQWPMISGGAPSARTEFVYNIDEINDNAAIRMGKYKLIQGSPGIFNGWTPLPPLIDKYNNSLSFPPYQLFDLDNDPTEHFDIADQQPDVLNTMKSRLENYRKSLVPANFPKEDKRGDPKNFGGVWSPGWC